MNEYTCKGRIVWDDPDDPTVCNVSMRDDGSCVVDNVLQQVLAEVWRDHGNLASCKVRITVENEG